MENDDAMHLEFKQPKSSMRVATVLILYCLSIIPARAQREAYEVSWNRVYRFELNDHSKSALTVVDSIYTRAKLENNFVQITRSVLYQSKFALNLQPESELYVIEKFRKEVRESTPPLKNLLESMIGSLLMDFWKQNRWKYRNRSQLTTPSADFRTWDEATMRSAIDSHFRNSLQDAPLTQAVNLNSIAELLAQSDARTYRPTLYDLLAHRALEFYTSENGGTQTFYTDMLSDERLFQPFGNIPMDTLLSNKPVIRIYKSLYVFHAARKDTVALVDLELNRIEWLTANGSFQNANDLRKQALERMKKIYRHHRSSAWIDFELSKIFADEAEEYSRLKKMEQQDKYVIAVHYCDSALTRFPNHEASKKCDGLKQTILMPAINLVSEKYVPAQLPSRILLTYKNISKVRCSVFSAPDNFEESFHRNLDSVQLERIKQLPLDTAWAATLNALLDYQQHSTEIAVPPLASGQYLIFVTVDGEPTYAYTFIHVTNIVLLASEYPGGVRYQVVARNTGVPISGAAITITSSRGNAHDSAGFHQISNADGFVWFSNKDFNHKNIDVTVRHHEDEVTFSNYLSYSPVRDPEEDIEVKAVLFTDRSIYRPGQTVYFKGILVKSKDGRSGVAADEYVKVDLDDPEGNEIHSTRLKTNEFGSFSGEFVLPASGLTGMYDIEVKEDFEEESELYFADFDGANEEISVEEYKRPGFEITFEPLTGVYHVNDTIRISGGTASFSGAELGGAKVRYHITRETYYYPRNGKRRRSYNSETTFVSGETNVNSKGEFAIGFYAAGIDEIPRNDKPLFYFTITADITDITGETHSKTLSVKAGYQTYTVSLDGPDKIEHHATGSFAIMIRNLNDQPAETNGVARVYKISRFPGSYRDRPWDSPDLPILTREQFSVLFPHDIYTEADLVPSKDFVAEIPFQKGQSAIQIKPDLKWPTGEYEIELVANDPSGLSVSDTQQFSVTESGKRKLHTELLWIETDKRSYSTDDRVKVSIGSCEPGLTLTIDIERDHKIIKTYTQTLSGTVMELIIPTNELMTRGFLVHCSGVVYNSFFHTSAEVIVIPKREKLTLETLTFRDKIKPGSDQTWSFRIRGMNSSRVEAELLASMYDASLDQFRNHYWSFNPFEYPYGNYSSFSTSPVGSFGTGNFSVVRQKRSNFNTERLYYEQLDWFGFSIIDDPRVSAKYYERLYPVMPHQTASSKIRMTNTKNRKAGHIYGRVLSQEGDPLPGVSITVMGTQRGTQTDLTGNYDLEAKSGEKLVFSFIGFATLDIKALDKNTIDVVMREEIVTLNEIVVVASGLTVQRRELGNQATTVIATDVVNPMAGLSGKIPGLVVSAVNSGITPSYRVVLRGQRSLLGNNQALLILDGVIVPGGVIESLSADDISSIDVLNGSAASALYGSDGTNGALIINTFSGQKKLDAEMAKVNPRKIFNETAFFFPHLTTDETGMVNFSFITPESLTRWKLMMLGHTKSLTHVYKTMELKTQKEFMTTVHAPRFLRAADEVTFSVKINNLTSSTRKGTAALLLTDAVTGQPVDADFDNQKRNQPFTVGGRSASELVWRLKIPKHVQAVQYKVVARSGEFSDGEQNVLPVLSHQMLVTETLPLAVRSGEPKTFVLDKLKNSNPRTMKQHRLVLQVNANPAWYAVQALPYLMEFPYECAEQTFSRYYSNLLAMHIVNNNSRIKTLFSRWSDAKTLTSSLENNPELKSILLEETPWLRDARDESEQKKRIALLFDLKSMNDQLMASMVKLNAIQLSDGGFPWFSGGPEASRYITQHIVTGLGHLRSLHVEDSITDASDLIDDAIRFLDREIQNDYTALLNEANRLALNVKPSDAEVRIRSHLDTKNINNLQVQYLYARSFFATKIPKEAEAAVSYFRKQAADHWRDFPLYLRGMIAIIAHQNQQPGLAKTILRSLKENAIVSDELGMYWKENTGGYYWHQSEIETQAQLIEVFTVLPPLLTEEEKLADIELLKTFLLKHKQVNGWKSTKATTEAIYALLLTGNNWLDSNEPLQVSVGNEKLVPDISEADSGLLNASWTGDSIKPELATVTISKRDPGIAWGSLYWQYFEDLDQITSAETQLNLSKKVYQVSHTAEGDVLKELSPASVIERGALLRVRIEVRTDRKMEFIHMKDMRAAGLEPMDVLSGYKWQNGVGYYQSTRDAATNFFFDVLNPGVYVFEYDLRAVISGSFSNGITTLQNMYAPEFSSHSEGIRISIK